MATRIVGVRSGVGALTLHLKEIKEKAVHQQGAVLLAKAKVDELIPANASLGPFLVAWSALAPAAAAESAAPPAARTRSRTAPPRSGGVHTAGLQRRRCCRRPPLSAREAAAFL